jgi:aspartyl-tRNA(Asn)/glutamyl-tRNA(Gln) amidotransferase subunit A
MITEDILFAPIREQASLIKLGKLSPVELTKAYLERLEKYGTKLGAVVTITKDLALQEAKSAEEEIKQGKYRGLLHGIPYGVKDLLATKGIPTTWGAAPFKDQVFDYDATVVEKLRAAGAILLAKLAMVELAGGFGYNKPDASFTGPGKSPWNTNHWSGGSSSGPGAATGAGLVSFSIGSETSGSIVNPSTSCGVSGLRPTYGRVSRYGAMALCWSLDKIGPMCRTADCCGIVLKVIAGRDSRDGTSVDKPFEHPDELPKIEKKFKIGFVRGARDGLQAEVKKNFEAALEVVKTFADIVEKEVAIPELPFGSVLGTILSCEAASAFRELLESGKCLELQNENDKTGGYSGLFIPAVDYLHAQRLRGKMKKAMHAIYEGYDALICPTFGSVSQRIDGTLGGGRSPSTAIIPSNNVVGQPAISVPMGFGQNNLPTGISFTGRIWTEAKLVLLARLYQKETDWHKKQPELKFEEPKKEKKDEKK